jgi:hypothetical protein
MVCLVTVISRFVLHQILVHVPCLDLNFKVVDVKFCVNLLQISGERSAQPARYDPDNSRLFARSHEKDGDSWQMTPPQHPNYFLNHSPTGMMIVSFGLGEAAGLCLHIKYFVLVFHLMLLWMVSLRIVRKPYSSSTSSQLSVLV